MFSEAGGELSIQSLKQAGLAAFHLGETRQAIKKGADGHPAEAGALFHPWERASRSETAWVLTLPFWERNTTQWASLCHISPPPPSLCALGAKYNRGQVGLLKANKIYSSRRWCVSQSPLPKMPGSVNSLCSVNMQNNNTKVCMCVGGDVTKRGQRTARSNAKNKFAQHGCKNPLGC